MSKKLFNFKLYLEGLRQLKILWIIFVIIVELGAVITPIGQYTSTAKGNGTILINYSSANLIVIFLPLIFVPIMTLYIFNFINKRNISDFYHSVPSTRTSIFFSFFAAIVTCTVSTLILSIYTSYMAYSFISRYYVLNNASVSITFFNMLAGSLFTCAAVMIAMSVTGTVFSNVVLSVLVIILPRFFMFIFNICISFAAPVVPYESFFPFAEMKYNVVTNAVLSSIPFLGSENRPYDSFTYWQGGLYTLIVSIIYIIFALLLFNSRKSETAGKSAPNKILQNVYRLLFSMLISLFPCILVIRIFMSPDHYRDNGSYFILFLLYMIVVFFYFLYELISTKKLKNLVKAFPTLWILVLINLVFIFGVKLCVVSVENTQPAAENISAVRFLDDIVAGARYEDLSAGKVKYNQAAISQIVSEGLSNSVKKMGEISNDSDNIKTVKIYFKGKSIERYIEFSDSNLVDLAKYMTASDEFKSAYMNLPSYNNLSTIHVSNIDPKNQKELYNSLRSEIKTVDFTQWYNLIKNNTQNYKFVYMKVTGNIGTERYVSSFPLSTLTPVTSNLYMKLVNENNIGTVLDKLSGYENEPVFLSVESRDFGKNSFSSSEITNIEDVKKVIDAIKNTAPDQLDITKPHYCITVRDQNEYYYLFVSALNLVYK